MIPQLTENPGKTITITAREILQPYRFVGFSGHVCGAGEKSLGVAVSFSSPFHENDDAAIVTDGVVIIEVSEEISPADVSKGIAISSDINGRGVKAKNGEAINGYAVSPATGQGDHIRLKLV